MKDGFDETIKIIVEEFDSTPTTEDPRSDDERRCQCSGVFPIVDAKGNVIDKDRRNKERRSNKFDIDDISDYDYEIH